MAATDAFYRDQKKLNIVFAVSSLAMLATIVGMFYDDYAREWKAEQRVFRDVEEEMAKRNVLDSAPSPEAMEKVLAAQTAASAAKQELKDARDRLERENKKLLSDKIGAENRQRGIKADYDSVMSFYNGASERSEEGAESSDAQRYRERVEKLRAELDEATRTVEELTKQYDEKAAAVGIPDLTRKSEAADKAFKDQTADFDRFVKLASQKRWKGWNEGFRSLPIIDAFSSPTKIQQYTLDELPIDYSFKYVTRYDRCTTCHQGMEKSAYDRETLAALTRDPDRDAALKAKYDVAKTIIDQRRAAGAKDLPDPELLKPKQLPKEKLTEGRVTEFCAHPRLELFVDAASPHPVEKFGCTICHSGQGSSTSFKDASHSPSDIATEERWAEHYKWTPNHFWDMPMAPKRFLESSCVKCHHQITDLVRDGSKTEAPKLVKGYNLVRDLGCFGCHEIAGIKSGRRVGPDLRLEPDPPLDVLSAADRAKATADPLNPPGTMRKVGPSLFRVSEKTNEDWTRHWIKSPRDFRPDTKMPHFYGRANNNKEALEGTGQEKFPDCEINAVTHYLFRTSEQFLKDVTRFYELKGKATLSDAEKADLAALETRSEVRTAERPVAARKDLDDLKGQADRGRVLFSERGCLACHQHEGTATDQKLPNGGVTPTIVSEATFGPDLSRLAAKIGVQAGRPETGTKWLIAWLLNPPGHSPRTLMPVVHLEPQQAADVAAWLLSQKALADAWVKPEVAPIDPEALKDLAKVYLNKVLTKSEVQEVLKSGLSADRLKQFAVDADEHTLQAPISDDKLLTYVGKKGISNLGCYACHNIPGFQAAKPIGTGLNEWGKKDPDRLAFEDAPAFVKEHFNVVDRRDDPKDPSKPDKDWKADGTRPPYEKYFADMLGHHGKTREGFLSLKLTEPRSYDYNRIKTWDERLRMPQFKFSRMKRAAGESDAEFAARASQEEAEAREAVMTFVLGLLAEPIPAKYVHNPTGDRAAEVRGRQVLEKFNCAGCHTVRSGIVEFSTIKPGAMKLLVENTPELRESGKYKGPDHIFPEHNLWVGPNPPKNDRLTAHFSSASLSKVGEEGEEVDAYIVRLAQALRVKDEKGVPHDVPGGADLPVQKDAVIGEMTPPFGGTFAHVLIPYLQKKDAKAYGKFGDPTDKQVQYAWAAAPPSLATEGEKVQPDWLYQFLLNPHMIRPLTVLRMPRFNMSSDEATALVNYFTSTEKATNPGIGLTYPYVAIPQRADGYIREKTAEYVARLKQAGKFEDRKKELAAHFEIAANTRLKAAQERKATAEGMLKTAQDTKNESGVTSAKAEIESADAEAKRLQDQIAKKTYDDVVRDWEEREAYIADASRLVINRVAPPCLTCHKAAGYEPNEPKGPNLDQVADRLRPEWTRRWIANPQRFLSYTTIMPINFPADKTDYQEVFVGNSAEQIQAARDFLLLYPQVRDWSILRNRPVPGATTGGKQ